MAIPERFIDELVARIDIADVVGDYVHLTPKGGSLWGLCPFHSERTPSFHVLPDRQMYKCFGCGKGGGAINFIMEMEHLSYPDAVHHLARRVNMEVPDTGVSDEGRKKLKTALAANKAAARFFHDYLKGPQGGPVRDYIAQRQITPKFVTRFGLGAAPGEWDTLTKALMAQGFSKMDLIDAGLAVAGQKGNVYDKFRSRLMLPVIDVRGDVVAFTSRILPGVEGAKYLNSPDTVCFKKSQQIYALNLAKATKRPNLILVEGNIDVITLHQAGFDNVVATMGTALTAEHARILSRYTKELVVCYDNDEAGKKSTDRALNLLKDTDLTVRVLQLPNAVGEDGKPLKQDPDDFVRKFGPAAFERCLNGSAGQNDYKLDVLLQGVDMDSDEERLTFLRRAVETVANLSSPIEREIYGTRAAQAAKITPAAFAQEVDRFRKGKDRQERRKEVRRELTPTTALQPQERALRYENLRSARAEEGVIRLVLMDPALFARAAVEPEQFSSPVLGKIFSLLRRRHDQGLAVAVANIAGELTGEEMSHLVHITETPESRGNAGQAMADYIKTITEEYAQRQTPKGAEELLALQARKRNTKMEDGQ